MQINPPHISEDEIAERQKLGQDIRDEEWEGVYHVTPSPTVDHQRVLAGLIEFLSALSRSRGGGTVLPEINVFRESPAGRDYRVPDVVFVAAGREHIIARDGMRGGAPDVVIEILSPRDESYAKFGFFAAIGVPEVIIVEPETRRPEMWKLADGAYSLAAPGPDGKLVSERLDVTFFTMAGEPPRLEVVDGRDPSRRASI